MDLKQIVDFVQAHFNIVKVNVASDGLNWTEMLDDEDLAFVRRFVLGSGSLKAIASEYGVSYPTVRLRLDRLIAKITILESQEITSEFERIARAKHADGKIDIVTLKDLIAAHRREQENGDEMDRTDR